MVYELGIAIKLASAHLKVLKKARLMTARRIENSSITSLTGQNVSNLWRHSRSSILQYLCDREASENQANRDPFVPDPGLP
jgi:DNA-binding transcriptional ArsR family regulator